METFWEIDFNKKEKLSIDEAKFIFEQAEKQLKDTVESSELIINRTNTLITLVSGVLIALLGITVSKMEASSLDSIFFAGTLGSIYLFIIGIYIMKNIQPVDYVIVGEPPKTYFDDIYYSVEPSDKTSRLLWYYINTIQQYQKRIDLNKETNRKRWSIYETSVMLVIYTPLILAAIYLLCKLFFICHQK